jgi:hypothetical protein
MNKASDGWEPISRRTARKLEFEYWGFQHGGGDNVAEPHVWTASGLNTMHNSFATYQSQKNNTCHD